LAGVESLADPSKPA